jgi:hypothetical protein
MSIMAGLPVGQPEYLATGILQIFIFGYPSLPSRKGDKIIGYVFFL